MTRILVSAYAINPYKGSEDGTGWNLVCQIARFQHAIVITRENNQATIERYLVETKVDFSSNVEFLYYDLPYWMRFWKRGSKGALLYFYLWQLFLPLFVHLKRVQFDIAHHLNFHNDWTPTFLWMLGKPLVWGPIGHHPKIPFAFIKKYGVIAWLKDRSTWLMKQCFWNFDPFLRISLMKADLLLAVNSSVKEIHSRYKEKITVLPAVAASKEGLRSTSKEGFKVLSVGRFVPLKGFDVTIRAFAKFYAAQPLSKRAELKLVLVGKGPEKSFLQKIARQEGIQHAIEWIDWVDKVEMQRIYQKAHVFLFPSHEGAGMVVPEALSYGLPVLCFDNEGPGELTSNDCAIRVPYGAYEAAVSEFGKGLDRLYQDVNLREGMAQAAYKKWTRDLTWSVKGHTLQKLYAVLLAKKGQENPEPTYTVNPMNLCPSVETEF